MDMHFNQRCEKWVNALIQAVKTDVDAGMAPQIKQASAKIISTQFAISLNEMGQEIDGLGSSKTKEPISDERKMEYAKEIAKQIGHNDPTILYRIIKGGSGDTLLNLTREMAELFNSIKDKQTTK